MQDQAVINELKRIADVNGGVLRAADVVNYARPESSILHSRFEWDDTAAAEKWRLEQAGQLIRVSVEFLKIGESTKEIRAFVSLRPDRAEDGGGYRQTITVLSDNRMRAQLLEDALAELHSLEKRYAEIRELADVFRASRAARRSHRSSRESAGA